MHTSRLGLSRDRCSAWLPESALRHDRRIHSAMGEFAAVRWVRLLHSDSGMVLKLRIVVLQVNGDDLLKKQPVDESQWPRWKLSRQGETGWYVCKWAVYVSERYLGTLGTEWSSRFHLSHQALGRVGPSPTQNIKHQPPTSRQTEHPIISNFQNKFTIT